MNGKTLKRAALCMALGACIASMVPLAMAQAVNGSVVGRSTAGDQITVTNQQTGLTRTVTVGANGEYRLSQLPVGNYSLQVIRNGQSVGEPAQISVNLGGATTINLNDEGAVDMAAVQVVGSRIITPVDVRSTESALNITAEELERLPVDRDVASVALLAPGVGKGNAGFGGISFGGSSVAENAFYVNGLNVTDFYNRVGFSEAPFSFYDQFEVKTGGYSVEFGRTTGGVVNAVAKSGGNEFHYGAELVWTPEQWQAAARNSYFDGERYLTRSRDTDDSTKLNVWASGPIIKDRLFFFAMYEGRAQKPIYTDNAGSTLTEGDANDGFWGTTIDWQITDRNRLSLMAFSNQNRTESEVYSYDFDGNSKGTKVNDIYEETGGRNWAATWSSSLTDDLSMKLMYGRNERQSKQGSPLDGSCNYVTRAGGVVNPGVPVGCTTNSSVYDREDTRKQMRADFEWALGDHLLRFGIDREENVSDLNQYYPGPGGLQYNVYTTTPGTTIPNSDGGVVPPGYTAYVRTRQYSVSGNFETTNSAFYLEDNWQVTDRLMLNLGIRNEAFDNKDAEGRSYIKMDNMWAPRFGFSFDVLGDGTTKLFGNVGRYFLPVANVINIKQAGALLDARTYYGFDGWQILDSQGSQYAMPILGPQFGFYDGQGDGTVGDLRSEVDRDMDQVYQDELILGFQQQISETWSWAMRGVYRRLNNAIDDMEISATGACGPDGYVGWVMANPGKPVTVWADTSCGAPTPTYGWVTIDTAKEGWAMYDADGNYLGQRGWVEPKRTYKALELQFDRAWDGKWAFNASYTMSWSQGNAEGPVNTDTNFGDTGRTENFDDPWVNFGGYGPLANDHRHQIKLRGVYALTDNWQVGATLDARSGGPITAFGVGNPYDATAYHSYFICVANCDSDVSQDRVYQYSPRGDAGRMPWTFDVGANVSYERSFGAAKFKAKLAFFNVFNQQQPTWVYQELEPGIGDRDSFFKQERFLQSPRYGQLTVSLSY